MAEFGAFFFGFIPMFLFAAFVNWLDRYEKEPKILLGTAFVWGAIIAAGGAFILITALGMGIYALTGSRDAADFGTTSIAAPIFEEGLKGLAVVLVFFLFRREFDSVLDGIIYAAITAMGFAAVENTLYIYQSVFRASTVAGILALILLVFNIIDGAFGYAALEYRVDPKTLAVDGVALEDQSQAQLVATLQANISKGAYNKLENEQPFSERSAENVYQLIVEPVVRYKVDEGWSLWESLTQADVIKARVASDYPEAELRFINWLNADFVSRPQTSEALTAGIRTAILGSFWTIFITILFAFPVGVGAAI